MRDSTVHVFVASPRVCEVTWVAGIGLGGQRLFIIPELDLVVTVTSGLYRSPRQGVAPLDILYRFVIPAVSDKASDRVRWHP